MTLICYCIQNTNKNKTYIGATNDFSRRIRQHNGIISGGAKSTKGDKWAPIIHISGFIDRHQLLRFEWFWKHCYKSNTRGVFKRIEMLEYLLKKTEWQDLKVFTNYDVGAFIDCFQEISELFI
jgi:predicted GIY-YIG superfamily endonuclease